MNCFMCESSSVSFVPTPCGHKLCLSCLVKFVKDHSSTKCPKCSIDFSLVQVPEPLVKIPNGLIDFRKSNNETKSRYKTPISIPKKRPEVKNPGLDASPYDKALYERKLILKKFNDNKISLVRASGEPFRIADYHSALRKGEFDRNFDTKYFDCVTYTFDPEDSDDAPRYVYIPKVVETSSEVELEVEASSSEDAK